MNLNQCKLFQEYREEELPLDYQIQCHVDRMKHYVPKRRMLTSNKSTHKSKNDQNQLVKTMQTPSKLVNQTKKQNTLIFKKKSMFIVKQSQTQVQSQLIDSKKAGVENQFTIIEEIPSNERIIIAPQGSIASDIQKAEDLNENDENSDTEQIANQQINQNDERSIINNISNLKLDSEQVS